MDPCSASRSTIVAVNSLVMLASAKLSRGVARRPPGPSTPVHVPSLVTTAATTSGTLRLIAASSTPCSRSDSAASSAAAGSGPSSGSAVAPEDGDDDADDGLLLPEGPDPAAGSPGEEPAQPATSRPRTAAATARRSRRVEGIVGSWRARDPRPRPGGRPHTRDVPSGTRG